MRRTFTAIPQLAELIQDAIAFEALAVANQRFAYILILETDKTEAVLSALLEEMAPNGQCAQASVFGFEVGANDFFGDERLCRRRTRVVSASLASQAAIRDHTSSHSESKVNWMAPSWLCSLSAVGLKKFTLQHGQRQAQ
jgi:hypothetical protein